MAKGCSTRSTPADSDPMSDLILWHYDGQSALRRQVRLLPEGDGFRLEEVDGGALGAWIAWDDLTALRPGKDKEAQPVYGHSGISGWRIGFTTAPPPAIAARLPTPERYGRWIDGPGLLPAIGIFTGVAALSVWLLLQSPAWLAPLVPQSWENQLGDALVGDFGGRFCRTPEGQAALQTLVRRIDRHGETRDVAVANIPLDNAIALPGGRIILFDGLVQQARSPDELAGVLGHELGHVRHRDTLTALMRQAGLSVVLGGFGGDSSGYLNMALSMAYSRKAEQAADEVAIDRLRDAGISPAATAAFFERVGGGKPAAGKHEDEDELATWFSTHPQSAARARHYAAAVEKGKDYRPALDAAQWQALRRACKDDPDVAEPWRRPRWSISR